MKLDEDVCLKYDTYEYKNLFMLYLQFPNLSPKCLAALFMASVTLAFIALETAVPKFLSIASPAPQSSRKAPERL